MDMKELTILGIESSCDETAAAVVRSDPRGLGMKILSNTVASQVSVHRLYGGVVPEIAGRAHIEAVSGIVSAAMDDAGLTPEELDAVAVTTHPGLIGALLVGVNFAKALSYSYSLPLVPVNHIHAHICAAFLETPAPEPPYLCLVVSGGHTSIGVADSHTSIRWIGGTRDDAAGEAFDKVGRVLGFPYPAGAEMDRAASEADSRRDRAHPYVKIPSPALPGDGLEYSFSGLKSASLNAINKMRMTGEEIDTGLFASEFTNALADGIVSKIPAAAAASGCRTVVMAGGVAANSHLRAALERVCRENGLRLIVPAVKYCTDNGAMVAAAGVFGFAAGLTAPLSLNASAED